MPQPGVYEEPLRTYGFRVEVRDLAVAEFSACSGIEAAVQPISYRSGGDARVVHQLPGQVSYTPCVLRWGVTTSDELWRWMEDSLRGTVVRRDVSVIMLGADGVTEAKRYNLFEAWPCEWRGAVLDSMTNEVAIETLSLAYERVEQA